MWKNRLINDNGSACKITVDGTDFKITQPKPFNTGWFSHKFRGPGLRYEVAVSIQSSNIVFINGPFPCGHYPDIKIFRLCLKEMLEEAGERCEADKGYRGEPLTIDTPNDMAPTLSHKQGKTLARARHETCNARFKNFNCLNQKYRHSLSTHGAVFRAVAVITQLSFKCENKLFNVKYKTYSI